MRAILELPPLPLPLVVTHVEPLYRQCARDVPLPEQIPDALASVKSQTAPVGGDAGGLANVHVGGIQVAAWASTIPASIEGPLDAEQITPR
jgi:hypothetical protein